MMEEIRDYLKSKLDYDLTDYALYEIEKGKSKLLYAGFGAFALAVVLFILDLANVIDGIMPIWLLLVLLVLFVAVPLLCIKTQYEAVVVTPAYLVKYIGKKNIVAINYDNVTGFKISDEGINIKEKQKRILLSVDMFREEVDPIIDILEAKGKTFDKSKDYMIRDIHILIKDNKVIIEDDETETEEDKLYARFADEFTTLTPGFFKEVIFRNSLVDDVLYEDDHIFLYLNSIVVKGGHPENTTFGNIEARDCILILEKVEFERFCIQDINTKERNEINLESDIESAIEYLSKSSINEWKCTKNKYEFSFASGVRMVRTSFKAANVIIGWNDVK